MTGVSGSENSSVVGINKADDGLLKPVPPPPLSLLLGDIQFGGLNSNCETLAAAVLTPAF